MAGTFFTSDTHYFHDNIIKYCNRPYANVDEMNEALVQNWNAVVRPADTVYHLGDVAFRFQEKFEHLKHILARLNGKKYLVLGNHDVHIKKKLANIHAWMPYIWEDVFIGEHMFNQKVMLCHYPTHDVPGKLFMRDGGWMLHGHEHAFHKRKYRMLDVGVDAHNYTPIEYEQVFHIMKDRRDYTMQDMKEGAKPDYALEAVRPGGPRYFGDTVECGGLTAGKLEEKF